MTDSIDITLEESETGGRYVHRGADGTGPEAEMTFSKAGAKMIIIDHTGVPDAYKGQGVGLALVERAVADDERPEGLHVADLRQVAGHRTDHQLFRTIFGSPNW